MCPCKVKKLPEWNVNSVELLRNAACLKGITRYSIRAHMSANPHFDYAIGNPRDEVCIDFIIPFTNSTVTTTGVPVLPKERRKLIFMPAHDISFLVNEKGKVETIDEDVYGAGTWWVVENGSSKVEKVEGGWHVCFGNKKFRIAGSGSGKDALYLIIPSRSDKFCAR